MSSGLPVIVTDKMGPKEMVKDGQTGFITHDDGEFRQKIDLLVNDDRLRKNIGKKAREYALSRSWDAVFERLFEDYRMSG
jgi:glycosyltransferase involved in cell wall biosynthesis